jgi:DNA-binding NarL/FixJ family response regulator
MPIRIVLCDDHQIIREGLRSLLEKQPDMAVVGEALNGLGAIKLVADKKPDIVVLDIAMPEMNGIAAARRIFTDHPKVKILALSIAIRTIISGGLFISPNIAGNVLEEFARRANPGHQSQRRISQLSHREKEILQLISEGHSTKEIAAKINVSVKTVETHRQHIMQKVGVHNVAALTKYAVREGLTSLE